VALFDQIAKDLVLAMKSKDPIKVSTLRLLRSDLKNRMIEKKDDRLSDEEVLSSIHKMVKRHNDAIEGFKKGHREDLVQKEETERAILQAYLPEQISPDEIVKVVQTAIKKLDAQGPKSMGLVMKEALTQLKGQADGKEVSAIVNAQLKAL
jgi:uncharacterized protein